MDNFYQMARMDTSIDKFFVFLDCHLILNVFMISPWASSCLFLVFNDHLGYEAVNSLLCYDHKKCYDY